MLCSNRRSLYTWFDWLCFEKIEWPSWLSSFDTSECNNYTRQSEEASVWVHSTLEWFGCSETTAHPPARRVFCVATGTKKEEKTRKETITRLIFVGSKVQNDRWQICKLIWNKSSGFGERKRPQVWQHWRIQVTSHKLQVSETLTFFINQRWPEIYGRQQRKGKRDGSAGEKLPTQGPDLNSETWFPHSPVIPNTAEEVQGFP